jgi:hypothetical protein
MRAQVAQASPEAKSSTVAKAPVAPAPLAQTPVTNQTSPESLSARLQGGSPLPMTTRQRMERSFGQSFSDVRVHTGAIAQDVTQSQSADALTINQKIAFAPGQFRPGTSTGDHLIAHELAHVVQQSAAGGRLAAQAHSSTSSPPESAEVAADVAADRVMQGKPAALLPTGLSTRGRIMRRARAGGSTLPAMTVVPPVPGFGRQGDAARSRPSSVTTGLLSPAGNQLPATVGEAPTRTASKPNQGRQAETTEPSTRDAPQLKGPDEAQTPQPQAESSPPAVAVAGTSAGAALTDAQGGAAKTEVKGKAQGAEKKEKAKEEIDNQEKEQEKQKEEVKEEVGTAKAKKKRKFGQIPGDRGAAAARAAAARLTERADAMQHHEPAGQRITDARGAAVPPSNEGESRAQGSQVGTVAEADAPPPQPDAARQDVRVAVEAAAPANMEEMGDMGDDEGSRQIQSTLSGVINSQVQGVRGTLDAVNNPPAPVESPPPEPQPEPEGAPNTLTPNLANAAPPAVPDETLDAGEFREEAEDALNAHDIDDETLRKAEEGPLKALAEDKESLDQEVDQSANNVRAVENPALAETTSALESREGEAQSAMTATREGRQGQVVDEQGATRTGEETERQTVSDQIQEIYNRAAENVNGKLDDLTEQSTQQFDEKQREYLDDFSRDTRSELDDFKDERYSGPLGWTDWIADRFVSINNLPAVKAIYQRNRDRYIQRIDTLISQITGDINRTITECKETLESAKQEIQTLVDNLPTHLQEKARAAQQRVEQQFAQMEQRIDQAAASTKSALQQRRQQSIEAVDRALAEIQAENEALLDKIANFVNRLAEALGKFLQLMTRITRMGIGSFLSSALAQAKEGVHNHLWGSLQEAFKQWVFSKIPFLEPLLNLPSNWLEMLTEFVTNLPQLFIENLPQMLPNIATAAMTWLATNLAAKLIPGAGTIMAIIDGIRAAYGLVQNLFSAAEAFFGFIMKAAQPAFAAVDFANALARGIVAGLDAILTFLGVDRLIMRVGGAIARPFGRIFNSIAQRFRGRRQQRTAQRQRDRDPDRRDRERDGRPDDPRTANERRRAQDEADRDDQRERRRREDDHRRQAQQDSRRDPRNRRDRDPDSARRQQRENNRRQQEERDHRYRERAQRELPPKARSLLRRGSSSIRLRAQLAIWKIQYHLSVLRFERRGQSLEFDARINPVIVLEGGIIAAGAWFLRLIRRRAKAILTDPQVIELADAINRGEVVSGESGGIAAGARANLLQKRQGPRGGTRSIEFPVSGGGTQAVSEFRPRHHATNRRVDFQGQRGDYGVINRILNNPEEALGITREQAAQALAHINRTREIPANLPREARAFLATVARVDEVEGGRNPADIIARIAERDIAEHGGQLYTQDPSTGQIVESGAAQPAGSHVMGPRGAPAAARTVQEESGIPRLEENRQASVERPGRDQPAARRLSRREWDIVISYIIQKFGGQNAEIIMANESQAEELIDAEIRALIRRRIGL